ncbi:MAG: glycosyltransferase [Rhodobacteraceae bacterium]|nr:glycosyltransferase [Paracoccaceae bacterium]
MNKEEQPLSFCIALCSRQRPQLLRRCLASLDQLVIPEDIAVSVLVVENNETSQYQEILQDFGKVLPLTHVSEPRAGLVYARNKILDTVAKMQVDWMGGVDDDQIIDQQWLVHMVAAIREFPDTKVFVGDWRRQVPKDVPYWYPTLNLPKKLPTGALLREAVSGNTAIDASVFRASGMGLRFDMAYNFLGGEDTDFGVQYLSKGGKIRFVSGARTEEDIHDTRTSLKARLKRVSMSNFILAKVRHHRKSAIFAWGWTLQILYRSMALGVVNLILAGVALPFRERWAMKRYGVALKFYAKIRGIFWYYSGKNPEQYRDIDGN